VRRALVFGCAFACSLVWAAAWAQPGDVKDEARALALEAADLIDAKSYEKALTRVEKAEELFHAPTHLLLMGEALEGLGHIARAAEVYERLAAEAMPDDAPDPFREAQEKARTRLGDLLTRVPAVVVVVDGADPATATITVDGKPYRDAMRLDPGTHRIAVDADGFEPATREIELHERSGVTRVEMHLEAPKGPEPELVADEPGDPLLAPTAIAFTVGAAALVAGAVTGGLSLAKVGELADHCPDQRCGPDEQATIDEAGALGDASTGLIVVGGIAVATGITLIIVDATRGGASGGDDDEPELGVWLGPRGAGVRGVFW
jgi:PEGA domain-containing protein